MPKRFHLKHIAENPVLLRLARWPSPCTHADPSGVSSGHLMADRHDYVRDLLAELLARQGKIRLESAMIVFADTTPYFECMVRLLAKGIITEVVAGGSSPEAARFNAELFAIRQALFRNQEVPILGRLLSRGPLSVDLALPPDGWQAGDRFELIVRYDGNAPWAAPLAQGGKIQNLESEYRIEVRLLPRRQGQRTRYMEIAGLPAALADLVSPFMNTRSEIYLHRFIVALDAQYVNGLKSLAPIRHVLLGDGRLDRGNTLDVHHINGIGYDNRRENLQPLGKADHGARHRYFVADYNDPTNAVWFRASHEVKGVLRPPPRVIATPAFYDLVAGAHAGHLSSRADSRLYWANLRPGDGSLETHLSAPVTLAEIRMLAGRSDRLDNLRRVIEALMEVGGQATISELKCARSTEGMPRRTLHNALDCLIEGLIVAQHKGDGRGHADHYRMVRLLNEELFTAIAEERPFSP